jgi:NADH-quinone oxidoreductase subunit C
MSEKNRAESLQEMAGEINRTFQTAQVTVTSQEHLDVQLRKDLVPPFLSHAKTYLQFDHLAHMSVVDWLEEGELELVWILWSYSRKIQLRVRTRIDRENAVFVSTHRLWRQAHTYEREFHEMYGIDYEGHDELTEFILEDWDDLPPMRRDFDTVAFVNEHFLWRPGREDAKDVRIQIAQVNETPVPEIPINKSRKKS